MEKEVLYKEHFVKVLGEREFDGELGRNIKVINSYLFRLKCELLSPPTLGGSTDSDKKQTTYP